ncbi:MAG: ABC transporter permease subunit [Deltaproteobacteria bacterium]|nr:ABC transporter permease subunit [Deltaproteobacteria bacterium]
MISGHDKERAVRRALSLAALIAGSISGLIFFFLFYFSLPIISSGLIGEFLTRGWDPDKGVLGILPMIVGTVYIAGLAMIWATPIGIGLAAFIQLFSPKPLGKILRWTVEFMTGIPTVVYGFAALFFLVPAMRKIFSYGTGLSVLTASVMLALLVLPTITLIAQDRLATVPESQVLAALSLGASRMETFLYVLLPGAWRGLISAVVLGGGRAVGDTLIALMLAGNAVALPGSLLDSARTLTAHIALVTAADYESLSFKAIFVCGLVLFIFAGSNIILLRLVERLKR